MPNTNSTYFNSHHLLTLMRLSDMIRSGWQRDGVPRRRNLTVSPIKVGKGFDAVFAEDGQNPQVRTNVCWITPRQFAVLTYRANGAGEQAYWGDLITEFESGEGQTRTITLVDKFCRETSLRHVASAILSGSC
jgi:hypothetical protein